MSGTKRKRETPRRLGRGLAGMMGDAVSVTPAKNEVADASQQQGQQKGQQKSPPERTPEATPQQATPPTDRPDAVSPAAAAHTPADADQPNDHSFVRISIGSVEPSPYQPRSKMDDAALAELAASIRNQGVMQPILVRPRAAGGYELVAGERRWRAAALAGLEQVPAIVRELQDQDAAEFALVENIQREDLGPVERARAFRALLDTFGLTQQELADRVGLDRSSVANQVRLLELGDEILDLIEAGTLSAGHGKALLGVADPAQRTSLAKKAARQAWSVRALERAVRGEAELKKAASAREPHPAVRDLEARLRDHLGTGVTIKTDKTGKRGKLVVEFYDLDQFDGLLTRLGLPEDH